MRVRRYVKALGHAKMIGPLNYLLSKKSVIYLFRTKLKSKSRTESTSENCKEEDLPYGANLEDNQCTTIAPTDIEQNRKTIKHRLANCRSILRHLKEITHSLKN